MRLEDHTSKKRNIAELSRPARQLTAKIKDKDRKPQGRKRKNQLRPAKYHNWFTPFCWPRILLAAKEVGPQMGASDIVRVLKRSDYDTFANISRTTVNDWIDRKGDRPQWKETVLKRAEHGNSPGHNKGGRQGVLVRK